MASEFPEYFYAFGPQLNTLTSVGIFLKKVFVSCSNNNDNNNNNNNNNNNDDDDNNNDNDNKVLI